MVDKTLKNANIMVVDDAEANIAILEGFLLIQGYSNILTVNDPRNVLQLVRTFKPDLILLDLLMPHLSGYEVMELLKEVISPTQYLPILVLTADITDEAKLRALSGGAKDFLTKPLNLVEVNLRMKNLLETRYLYQQLENQNLNLEEKVKERTIELQDKNKELEIARDKAEAGDRLKTAFLQSISHEIRTPLNGILGFGELMIDPDVDNEDKETFFPLLKQSSDRLMKTINDYLDISLIMSGNMTIYPKTLAVTDVLIELLGQYQIQCEEKEISLSLEVPESADELILKTDHDMLRKMMSHLLDNAIKFTSSGKITFGYTLTQEFVEFFVSDTGIGIEPEALDQVFNIFTQGEVGNTRGYEGSGLGLSIVKGLNDLLGGRVHLESTPGVGTKITFSVSLNYDSPEIRKPVTRISSTGIKNQPMILIAEDEYVNSVFLEAVLSKYTSRILLAGNGQIAVELCKQHPEISLVLMDIRMPEMDGIKATRIIKSFRKELPVIALTAYAIDSDERQAIEAGCDDYLLKPFNSLALQKMLRKYGIIN